MRKSVDFPHPEGPTITMNSPSPYFTVNVMQDLCLAISLNEPLKSYSCHFSAYLSVSVNPLTKSFCMETTTNTGGSIARRAGHHNYVPLWGLFGGFKHLLDAHYYGCHVRICRLLGQWPKILIPAIDKEYYK